MRMVLLKVLSPALLNGKEDSVLDTDYLEGKICGLIPCSITSRNSHAGKWQCKENRSALGI